MTPGGGMLLGVPVAIAAGLLSFASPCVLPLVPGYLGYVGGVDRRGGRPQARVVVGAALFVLAATALITFSFRGTEVSAVSPFRYAGVPVALLIGLVVWGDAPNLLASLGIALVVGAGLFAMRREALRTKSA